MLMLSLFKNESLPGQKSTRQAEGLERGYSAQDSYDYLHALLGEGDEDARFLGRNRRPYQTAKTSGDADGAESALDDGYLQRQRSVFFLLP